MPDCKTCHSMLRLDREQKVPWGAGTMMKPGSAPPTDYPLASIASKILWLRAQKVMLDADLAALYGVETRVLVQAVKRNLARFPADFMFQLKAIEFHHLRSQSVISSGPDPRGWGGRRSPPYAFTEQGVAMLSSVLRSEHAIAVNVAIMRTFVRLREVLSTNQ